MTPVTLHIIIPQDEDYKGVWMLREQVLRRPLGLSLHNEDLSAEAVETIIAAKDAAGRIAGCLLMRPLNGDEVKLRQMAVAPDLQGSGIGRLLLQKAEALAREGGYKIISLNARQAAVPFYERAGYERKGEPFEEVGIPHLFMNKLIHAALP